MSYKAQSRHRKCVTLGGIRSCLNHVDPKFNFYPSIMTSLGNYCNIPVVQNYRKGHIFRRCSANYCGVKQPEFPFLTLLKLKSTAPHIFGIAQRIYTRYYSAALCCINILLKTTRLCEATQRTSSDKCFAISMFFLQSLEKMHVTVGLGFFFFVDQGMDPEDSFIHM